MRWNTLFLPLVLLPFGFASPEGQPGSFDVRELIRELVEGVANIDAVQKVAGGTNRDTEVIVQTLIKVYEKIINRILTPNDIPIATRTILDAILKRLLGNDIGEITMHGYLDYARLVLDRPELFITDKTVSTLVAGYDMSLSVGQDPAKDGSNHTNPDVPLGKVFYNNTEDEGSFSVEESFLRSAMYIPRNFTWGQKQPVLLVPGTGLTGYSNFRANIGKLLSSSSIADPVYLNVPGRLLGDLQVNAEYVAYALKYLHALTGTTPAVITFSQGGVITQWALRYWHTIRYHLSDFIAISPGFHGTKSAGFACGTNLLRCLLCTPAVIQQKHDSNFIKALRKDGAKTYGGKSAYVSTTTIYSGTDSIIRPQGGTGASAYLLNSMGPPVSNIYLQGACARQPAGGPVSHAGVLYNSVTHALVMDALKHDGPGNFTRVKRACADFVAPELSFQDKVETLALPFHGLWQTLLCKDKVTKEPKLRDYVFERWDRNVSVASLPNHNISGIFGY
ncbi:hypothetical protein B0O99DRAFT_681040 [Bisporella sp. PMI_857]|nr:hypothetical protein B0O99DRAFT_681040 [Bisporella sp. PMI_857]